MKCPGCKGSHKKKDGAVCGTCNYRFAFFPPSAAMTDGRMTALFSRVTANGTYEVLVNQLYASYAGRAMVKKSLVPPLIIVGVCVAVALFDGINGRGDLVLVCAVVALVALIVALFRLAPPSAPSRAEFMAMLDVWRKAGRGEGVITKPALHDEPGATREGDVHDYGLESVLVVDDPLLVDFLVRNHFHAETRTAVVAANGYPDYVRPGIKRSLAANPETPVFLLHAAGAEGESLARRAESVVPGLGAHPVIDLGFRAEDAERIQRLAKFKAAGTPDAMRPDFLPPKILLGALAVAMRERIPLAVPLGVKEIRSDGTDGGSAGDFMIYNLDSDFG